MSTGRTFATERLAVNGIVFVSPLVGMTNHDHLPPSSRTPVKHCCRSIGPANLRTPKLFGESVVSISTEFGMTQRENRAGKRSFDNANKYLLSHAIRNGRFHCCVCLLSCCKVDSARAESIVAYWTRCD